MITKIAGFIPQNKKVSRKYINRQQQQLALLLFFFSLSHQVAFLWEDIECEGMN